MRKIDVLKPSSLVCAIMLASYGYSVEIEELEPHVVTIVVVGEATAGLDALVSQDELDKAQASSLSDIFRNNPEVMASGSVELGQKLLIRDIGEDLISITVDGAEQAVSTFHHSGRLSLEPELLKQVEVEAGAGSATAGPGAIGGSIKFTTKDADELLDADRNFGALLKSSYFSNGDGFKNSATLYGKTDNNLVNGIVSFTTNSIGDIDDGDGNTINGTESDKTLGFAKVELNPNSEHELSISYENLTQEGDMLYKPNLIEYGTNNYVSPTEADRSTINVNYRFVSDSNDFIDFSTNVYQTESIQSRLAYNRFTPSVFGDYSTYDEYQGTIESIGTTLQNISLIGNQELIYGFNYRTDSSIQEGVDTNTRLEEEGGVWGLYLQDIVELTDRVTITGGVRYDTYFLTDLNDEDFEHTGLSSNFSTNYSITDSLDISAGYASVMRGIDVKDALALSSSISNDDDLLPERANNFELGLNYSAGTFNTDMGIYHTTIQDAFGYSLPWSKNTSNLEEELVAYGFYINTDYQLDRLSISANAKFSQTEVDGSTATGYVYGFGSTASATGDTYGLGLEYQVSDNIEAGWNSVFVASIEDIEVNLSDGAYVLNFSKPGYSVHDLYASWMPLSKHDLKLSLRVNNVFDEQYISHASVEDLTDTISGWESISGNYEPGRDIRITAAYKY